VIDLVEFLRARLDEDKWAARNAAADHPSWTYDPEQFAVYTDGYPIASHRFGDPLAEVDGVHIARHDPARVLREVEAKRRLISEILAECEGAGFDHRRGIYGKVLRSLAAPYADHPDYREEWRP
jgi:hypothetical protein